LLDQIELEASWVTSCLTKFDKIWETLSAENRGRLVRAVISRVEVDEPKNDVQTYLADLATSLDDLVGGAEEAA